MGIKDMVKDLGKKAITPTPTRDQLEANIKISHNWITAIRSGQFAGGVSLHVATLLDFLQKQNEQATAEYEAAAASHPEWGKQEAAK